MPIERVEASFDSKNPRWSRTYGLNRMFLQAQQGYANQLLANRGFLTLNEVFDLLDLPQTESGALTGWVGDIEVDFGEEADIPPTDRPSIRLQFNVNSRNVFKDMKK
jgi:hypothetical protein